MRMLYEYRYFDMNYIVYVGATILRIRFTAHICIGHRNILGDLLTKPNRIIELKSKMMRFNRILIIILNRMESHFFLFEQNEFSFNENIFGIASNDINGRKKKERYWSYRKTARCKYVFGINLSKMLDEKYNLAVFSSNHDV